MARFLEWTQMSPGEKREKMQTTILIATPVLMVRFFGAPRRNLDDAALIPELAGSHA
jgi:hypothetical protein